MLSSKNLKRIVQTIPLAAAMGAALMTANSSMASAAQIDCKVILCIAGGFPPQCGDAYSYMIDRITDVPPKPPFGFCAMSNGTRYEAYDVDYRWFHSGPESWNCPASKKLHYAREQADRGPGREIAFCYTHTTVIPSYGGGRDSEPDQIVYHGQSPANRVDLQLKITVEPGTQHQYRSPLFRVNTRTGYVSQRQW